MKAKRSVLVRSPLAFGLGNRCSIVSTKNIGSHGNGLDPTVAVYSRTSLRRSGSVAIVHGDILELVEHVRPCLEQLYPLWPIGRTIVCASDVVLVLVRKGRLDYVGIEASFVEGCIFSRSEERRVGKEC